MSKKIIAAVAITSILVPFAALAQQPNVPTLPSPGSWTEVKGIIDRIFSWLFAILLVVVAILVVYAGFNFITAAGDTDKINKARSTVTFAAVGLAVALLAKAIPAIVELIITGGRISPRP